MRKSGKWRWQSPAASPTMSATVSPTMNTRPISFAIEGMTCARCAVQVERALAELDGVIAAQVNYASERASVLVEPTRVTLAMLVETVQGAGFHTPLQVVTLEVKDLLYVAHPRVLEHHLRRAEGVVTAAVNLRTGQVTIVALPESASPGRFQQMLNNLGFSTDAASTANPARGFVARTLVLVAVMVGLVGSALAQFSSGAQDDRAFIGLSVLAGLATLAAGYPLYRRALAALLHGAWDDSVVIALVASALLIGGLWLAGTWRHEPSWAWRGWGGLTAASVLTTGWFVARSWTLWVLPRWHVGLALQRLVARHS